MEMMASKKHKSRWRYTQIFLLCIYCLIFQTNYAQTSSPLLSYRETVLPILKQECFECHNTKKKKGGLDMTSFHGLINGGLNGAVILEAKPEESPIYFSLLKAADPHMPPKKQLSGESISVVKKWISNLAPNSLDSLKGLDIEKLSHSLNNGGEASGSNSIQSQGLKPPGHLTESGIIDYYINHRLNKKAVEPANISDDRTFIRRVYLDLTGDIPTFQEVLDFVFNGHSDKRIQLIDDLLESDAYAVHMSEIFDTVLMGRRGESWENKRKNNHWFKYLNESFSKNRPWNQVIEELIVARPDSRERSGAVWFLYERENNYQAMAEAVAPLAFGTQMKCAQCHDHPLAHEIKQAHYWAMVAAFNRSKNISTKNGIGLSEAASGGDIEFANLKKETQKATLNFLNGVFVEELESHSPDKKESPNDKYLVPPVKKGEKPESPSIPIFSRRLEFAKAVSTKDNVLAARGMVNRIWAHLLGRGIVHPVDEINSFHPASHPELLDWLSQAYIDNSFDTKWLIRTIMMSDVYQRGRHSDNLVVKDPSLFAGAIEKNISAESLARAISRTLSGTGAVSKTLRSKLIRHFPDLFAVEFNATVQQAMFLSNSPEFNALLKDGDQSLTQRINQLDHNKDKVIMAFNSILLRNPDTEELEKSLTFLDHKSSENNQMIEYLLWALINSPEFMLNH